MPFLQLVTTDLNTKLGPGEIDGFDENAFNESVPLRDIVQQELGIGSEIPELTDLLDTAPHAVSYAFKAILRSAASRNQPVTVLWKPGYEWELSVIDAADTESKGGISVLVRSRYPGDLSPVPAPHGGEN